MFGFDELGKFFQERFRIFDRESKYASRRSAIHLQKVIKWLHWKQLPWYPAKGSNKTPLLDTGKLRWAVYAESSGLTWRVSTTEQKIARIQEFGAYWKMTDKQRRYLMWVVFAKEKKQFIKKLKAGKVGWKIWSGWNGYIRIPARPLWRYAESQQEKEVIWIFEDAMSVLFKN